MFSIAVDQEVSLRLLTKNDARALYHLVNESRAHLRPWLPWVDGTTGPEGYETLLPQWLQGFAEGKNLHVGLFYRDQLAGMIGFHSFDYTNQVTSLGYWLGRGYWGKGIVTRAVRKMIELAFQHYKMNRIEIRCAVGNKRSRAIPERLGFVQEGLLREAERIGDRHLDHVVYGLTRSQWKQKE